MKPLTPRPSPWKLTTSVLIPCAGAHAGLLPELVTQLASQTVLPDEVVISLSSVTSIPRFAKQPFRVKLITDRAKALAGKNRNRAADASTGDVLIYQDADDIAHPQRVEIAKQLFSNFYVEHLLHGYVKGAATPAWLGQRFQRVPARSRYEPYSYTHEFTNGNAVTTREVFQRVRWPEDVARGQDVVYNHAVRNRFPHRMVRLPLPLLAYRQHLSTAR